MTPNTTLSTLAHLLVVALGTLGCACATSSMDADPYTNSALPEVSAQSRFPDRNDGIAIRILELESGAVHVPDEAREKLAELLGEARRELPFGDATTVDEARQRLRGIAALLDKHRFVYPDRGYVWLLRDALLPVDVTEEKLKAIASHYRNAGRARALSVASSEPVYISDCDTTSALYLAIGQSLGYRLTIMDREPNGDVVGHNWVRWRLSTGEAVDWETMDGTEKLYGLQGKELGEDEYLAYIVLIRAQLFRRRGDYAKAVADYREALAIYPRAHDLNNLAWMLATSPDRSLRSGADAVTFAKQAVALRRSASFVDTLAAAYAESGEWDRAKDAQEEAVELAQIERLDSNEVARFEKRLSMYARAQPWRAVRWGETLIQCPSTSRDPQLRCDD